MIWVTKFKTLLLSDIWRDLGCLNFFAGVLVSLLGHFIICVPVRVLRNLINQWLVRQSLIVHYVRLVSLVIGRHQVHLVSV